MDTATPEFVLPAFGGASVRSTLPSASLRICRPPLPRLTNTSPLAIAMLPCAPPIPKGPQRMVSLAGSTAARLLLAMKSVPPVPKVGS